MKKKFLTETQRTQRGKKEERKRKERGNREGVLSDFNKTQTIATFNRRVGGRDARAPKKNIAP